MGFEPTRAEPNGLAVHRLNHSATSSDMRTYRNVLSIPTSLTDAIFRLSPLRRMV